MRVKREALARNRKESVTLTLQPLLIIMLNYEIDKVREGLR